MRLITDLHLHSRYARACSKQITIKNLEKYARIKGVDVLGTGDFQHPEWKKELKQELVEDGSGIAKTRTGFPFVFSTEISLMYSQGGKGRRIHNIVFAPNFEVVEQISEVLGKRGRLDYDGRPIFKIPCPEFVEMLKEVSEDVEIIPAHIWTPWFSLFGSKSGFDSIKECFQDQSKYINAIETGLSSDPSMNWKLSQLDNLQLVSFSDAHSFWPWRLGRETTIFEVKELTYRNLLNALRTGEGLAETIEFFPEEGKYHYDGHRKCNIVVSPQEAIKLNHICPKCRRPLTMGVAHRVEELADRPEGYTPKNAKPYKNLIPLSELISAVLKSGISTKTVWVEYHKLIKKFGNETKVLLEAGLEELKKATDERIAEIIIKNRNQKIEFKPGYDGVYGKPVLVFENRGCCESK